MVELLSETVVVAILALSVKLLPTILPASLGELVTEKSGVLNLGVEGLMLLGAYAAFHTTFVTQNPVLGLFAAMGVAALFGLFLAALIIHLHVNQVVLGLGVWLFGWGFTWTLLRAFFQTNIPSVDTIGSLRIPLLGDIPYVGRVLFSQNAVVYLTLLLIPAVAIFLNRTALGLRIRAVGEAPRAAETMGVSVYRTRYLATVIGAALVGLSGAYFTVSFLSTFFPNLTAGRGFIALASIYFGKWNPYRTFLPVFIFNVIDAIQLNLQFANIGIRYYFLNMTPYLAVVALIPFLGRRAEAPAALMQPFQRGR